MKAVELGNSYRPCRNNVQVKFDKNGEMGVGTIMAGRQVASIEGKEPLIGDKVDVRIHVTFGTAGPAL